MERNGSNLQISELHQHHGQQLRLALCYMLTGHNFQMVQVRATQVHMSFEFAASEYGH